MNVGKVIFFLIVGLGATYAANAAVSNARILREEEKKKEEEIKFIEAMREKYKDIKTWNDFHEGVKYVKQPSLFGYDLRILKDKFPNLDKIITFEDAKLLYMVGQLGLDVASNKDAERALDVLHKIYPL